MANDSVEKLEGCMCEYIPENLRDQINTVAEKTSAYTSQVVTLALQIGLAVILGNSHDLTSSVSREKHGQIKQTRKGTLSGKGA
jgi:hypothetical protein